MIAKQVRGKHPPMPWYRTCLVGIEIGPTGANDQDRLYMSKATGKDWVEALLRANCEYGVLFMKDVEFAYYNSKVARKCPYLGSRDILREATIAAKPHNLPIVAYCQVQYDDSSWRAHPEWRMKGWEDNDLGGRLCYNSGYVEFIKALLAEMMEYDIVGFHVDMLDYGFGPPVGCWCPARKQRFREAYGMDMPVAETWDDAWDRVLEFRTESNSRFSREIQAFVGDYRLCEHRNLLRNAVRALNPSPPVIIDAPANVETVVTRDTERNRLLVHFVAWNAPATFSAMAFPTPKRVHPPVMEEPTTYSATVRLGVPFRSVVMSEPTSRVRRRGDVAMLTSSSVHDVLIVRLAYMRSGQQAHGVGGFSVVGCLARRSAAR